MPPKTFRFNQGINTARDRSALSDGELTKGVGAYYKPGDTERIWKLAGRSQYGTYGAAGLSRDIILPKFDTEANDKLVILDSLGNLFSSALSTITSGSFTTLTTGLATSGENLAWCHYDDIWYIGNGYNINRAYESDGTLRQHGINPPVAAPTTEVLTTAYSTKGSVNTSTGWDDPELSSDASADTFAQARMLSTDTTLKTIIIDTFAASTDPDRQLFIRFGVGGPSPVPPEAEGPQRPRPQFRSQVTIDVDVGAGYVNLFIGNYRDFAPIQEIAMPISVDSAQVAVRVKYANTQLQATDPVYHALRLYDITLANSGAEDFETETDLGIHYAISEFDADNNLEGPLLIGSSLQIDGNAVKLGLPTTKNTDHTTSLRIYKTADGMQPVLGNFFLLATVAYDAGEYLDRFVQDKDYFGGTQPPLMLAQITDGIQTYYSPVQPPKPMFWMVEYKNFIVGISKEFPRALYYSDPGFPESWPELYVITDFPLKEHDQLQSLAIAGDLLIVGAKEAMIVINGLPLLSAQILQNSDMTVLRGAPGCVGPRAMMSYSVHGETRVAWLSKFGLYETNGHQMQELGTDIDWASILSNDQSKAFLYWDRSEQLMYVGYDSDADGEVDSFLTFHMADEHKKKNGKPKVTGPHAANICNIVGGQMAGGSYQMYSAQNTTGRQAFNEKTGGTDESDAFSTLSVLPFDIATGRIYSEQLVEWAVDFPTVRHSDWGTGAGPTEVAVTWKVGRDEIGEEESVVNTITMDEQQSTKFAVARSAEWHEISMQHQGVSTTGGILFVQAHVNVMGESGDTKE